MSNYTIENLGDFANLQEKIFLQDKLKLTGSEVSINRFSPQKGYDFVHSHKKNEELYIIIKGKALFYIDGKEFLVSEGSVIKVEPEAKRALKAEEDLIFICIQTQKESLTQKTREDGVLSESKASWMK